MGYIPAGIAFGVLFVAAGLPAWAAIFSSVVLYAGASQYASIALLSSGIGLVTIASNTLAINLRHAFYAIPLLQQLPQSKLARLYCLFALTDEAFSVLTTVEPTVRQRLMVWISLQCQLYWIIGTLLGVLIGSGLSDLIPHLDFALVCLFAILAYEQFNSLPKFYPILIAMFSFTIAMLWLTHWALLAAIGMSIGLLMGYFWLQTRRTLGKN